MATVFLGNQHVRFDWVEYREVRSIFWQWSVYCGFIKGFSKILSDTFWVEWI
jgi:hypothetical protein